MSLSVLVTENSTAVGRSFTSGEPFIVKLKRDLNIKEQICGHYVHTCMKVFHQ